MEEDKPAEENPTFPPTEPDQDTNDSLDMEGTPESSLGQEDINRPDIIGSSSSEEEVRFLGSISSKTDSETGETDEHFIWTPSTLDLRLPRVDHTTTSLSSGDSSKATESLNPLNVKQMGKSEGRRTGKCVFDPQRAEKDTPVSKGAFKIPPEVISSAGSSISVTEEKVEGADEIAVKNPKEPMVTIDAPARAELDNRKFSKNLSSRTVSTTSEDTLPDHGVYVSEESSTSSLEVSKNISSMKVTESAGSGLKPTLVESPSPSKRKMSDPDLSVEDCSGNPSKKVRKLPEEVSSESNQMTDEEQQEKGVASACSETVDTETDKGPLIEFSEEAEGCSKSERGSTKRTVMAEDVTDVPSDVKRIKPSD